LGAADFEAVQLRLLGERDRQHISKARPVQFLIGRFELSHAGTAQLNFCFREISGHFSFSVACSPGVRIMQNIAKRLRTQAR
jgi:hypothetical protein